MVTIILRMKEGRLFLVFGNSDVELGRHKKTPELRM